MFNNETKKRFLSKLTYFVNQYKQDFNFTENPIEKVINDSFLTVDAFNKSIIFDPMFNKKVYKIINTI